MQAKGNHQNNSICKRQQYYSRRTRRGFGKQFISSSTDSLVSVIALFFFFVNICIFCMFYVFFLKLDKCNKSEHESSPGFNFVFKSSLRGGEMQ